MTSASVPPVPPLTPAEIPQPFIDMMLQRKAPGKSVKETSPKVFNADIYRAVVWMLVVSSALVVWFSAPSDGSAAEWKTQMTVAEAIKTSNDSRTEGAPQQQVTNGWFTADALPIISKQLSGLHTAQTTGRVPLLLLVFGLGYGLDVVGRSLGSIYNSRAAKPATNAPKSMAAEAS
ncbi:hypothetical protein [Paeniglutamicibacter cryotolerans]|uniref:Uncharacterized protein n=1 Tax=Paeniglutamicibacter cryotolerans TaxID=670079 RepID=A0A839QQJ8_9MICC|nr:hypothetical protein [Paeniglutamicibacter cryotolerans]